MALSFKKDIALTLHDLGAIKFGEFILKSGIVSPVYVDLRVIISDPKLMVILADALCQLLSPCSGDKVQLVCGVPYSALPIATCVAIQKSVPMVMCRKEAKAHGTKQMVEGVWQPNQECVVIEDVVTSGSSLAAVVKLLRIEGIRVSQALILVDREQGGIDRLRSDNQLCVTSLFKLSELINVLFEQGRITDVERSNSLSFIQSTKAPQPAPAQPISFNPTMSDNLMRFVQGKSSRLCVAIDVTNSTRMLSLVDLLGPKVCAVKLHLDILNANGNFDQVLLGLRQLRAQHGFVLVEDRKLADIGQTVLNQMEYGPFQIGYWCDLITVHCLPGPGVFDAFRKINNERMENYHHHRVGALVVAQMSSQGALTDSSYSARCIEMSKAHSDVVSGFVSQNPLFDLDAPTQTSGPIWHWVPGVHLSTTQDQLGQAYNSPDQVLKRFSGKSNLASNVILIVGRGIVEDPNPLAMAEKYRQASVAQQ